MSAIKRIAIIALSLESNRFAPPTSAEDFHQSCYLESDDILSEAQKTAPSMPQEVPAFIDEMNQLGPWQPVPVIVTATSPGGPAEQSFFARFVGRVLEHLKGVRGLSGVYICSHGAMTATGDSDPDGTLYREVKALLGPDVPIVATVDLHANISRIMVDNADAIIPYRTNPHVDQGPCAREGARLLWRLLCGQEQFGKAYVRLPIVAPTISLLTNDGGIFSQLVEKSVAAQSHQVPALCVAGGFAFSDTDYNGITISAFGDRHEAERIVQKLGRWTWSHRYGFKKELTSVERAIELATGGGTNILLGDMGDNPGGGGRGNTTEILEALLVAGAQNVLFGLFIDADLVQQCHKQGVGAQFEAVFNRECCDINANRLALPVKVLKLSDGLVSGRRGFYAGRTVKLGPSAAIQVSGIAMVVISYRTQCADPNFFEYFGFDIDSYKTVVVKSRGHFRAGFDEFFTPEQIFEVDADGLTTPVFSRLNFKNLPRPVYPMDEDTEFVP
jgi:microcystin degradation protein MlrC